MRSTLTDEQFNTYLQIEMKAQGEERVIAAYGTQAAVADLLSSQKINAMGKFISVATGEARSAASVGATGKMSDLRHVINTKILGKPG